MKKNSTGKKALQKPKPSMKWQTGPYDRHPIFKFPLPYQFLLFCKLMNVTPERLLRDFTVNLSCESWERDTLYPARQHLINYFIAHGYGQQHYTEEEIRRVFQEMDAVGLLLPHGGKNKMLNLYSKWRDKHHHFWFKRWRRK